MPEDHQSDECFEPCRLPSPRLAATSSCYYRSLLSIDLGGIDLARKVDDMGHQLEALKVRSSYPSDVDFNTEPPFSPQIMSEAVSSKFRMPQAELYDGTTDPLDHIKSFKALMLLHRATDGMLCHVFSMTLRKAACF